MPIYNQLLLPHTGVKLIRLSVNYSAEKIISLAGSVQTLSEGKQGIHPWWFSCTIREYTPLYSYCWSSQPFWTNVNKVIWVQFYLCGLIQNLVKKRTGYSDQNYGDFILTIPEKFQVSSRTDHLARDTWGSSRAWLLLSVGNWGEQCRCLNCSQRFVSKISFL